MRYLIISISLMVVSCSTKNAEVRSTDIMVDGAKINEYVIDSCEYIGNIYNGSGVWATHKGNCKFCLQRIKTR